MSRNMILLGGRHGSGKSRLGTELKANLVPNFVPSVEHISVGNRVRAICKGAVSRFAREVIDHLNGTYPAQPMSDQLIHSIVSESLSSLPDKTDLVLLDGYPRYVSQVDSIFELAVMDDRRICGMIVTYANDETILARLIKRNGSDPDRSYNDPDFATWRLASHDNTFPNVVEKLSRYNVPIETVDTTGSKQATTERGLFIVASMLAERQTSPDESSSERQ